MRAMWVYSCPNKGALALSDKVRSKVLRGVGFLAWECSGLVWDARPCQSSTSSVRYALNLCCQAPT